MGLPCIGTMLHCCNVNERIVSYYHDIGLTAIQIARVYEEWLAPGDEAKCASDDVFTLLQKYGFSVPTMFLSYPEQDWAHPREGVGLTPMQTRAERMVLSCRQMNWAKRYGIRYITCHVGFPPEVQDEYGRLISDLRQLARFAAANDQEFLFETGMESSASLKRILDDIGEPNVGINFDPANLLLYGTDVPMNFLELLWSKIRVVHCKDAVSALHGPDSAHETVLGKGATNFAELIKFLLGKGFTGPLIIERELPPGPEQEKDIAEAVLYIKSIIDEA
ncbi:MAG: sugar phosphate isomerase/epimerase [Victivallales bacterium]|nr:sugar phosphate isomerase/epimerase [Victivallales bacterium]